MNILKEKKLTRFDLLNDCEKTSVLYSLITYPIFIFVFLRTYSIWVGQSLHNQGHLALEIDGSCSNLRFENINDKNKLCNFKQIYREENIRWLPSFAVTVFEKNVARRWRFSVTLLINGKSTPLKYSPAVASRCVHSAGFISLFAKYKNKK